MKKRGIIYILTSAFFFSLMALAVKSVPNLPLAEKVFFRNFIGLIAITITMTRQKISFKVNAPKLMFLRAFFGLAGVGLYYGALSLLPLADAVILNKISPIFVVIFALIFLKEPYLKGQAWVILLGLLGALLVIRPSFDVKILPALIALASAVSAGAAYTVVRRLTQHDQPTVIVFYFCLFSSIVLVPFLLIGGFVLPTFTEGLSLLAIGLFALIAQLFMTNAYKYAPASELSIYNYIEIVFSLFWGLLLWRETPDVIAISGALLIILAGYLNYRIQNSKKVKPL